MNPAPLSATPVAAPSAASSGAIASDRHANCFDALRLLLAALVMYSHTWLLGGFGSEPFFAFNKGQTIAGSIGVLGFFGLSGFLVAMSYERSRSVTDFLMRRIRRIFPGFWACIVVTAFVLGPLAMWLRHGHVSGYHWGWDGGALGYVIRNVFLRVQQWTVVPALADAPYSASLNGSLWSLFPEFCCYLVLALLGLAGLIGRRRHLLLLVTGCAVFFQAVHALRVGVGTPAVPAPVVLAMQAPYVTAFLVGACVHAFRSLLVPGWPGALVLCLLTALLLRWGGYTAAAPVVVPLLVIETGLALSLPLRADFSYGLYIYGFPVQQVAAAIPALRSHWLVFLGATLLATLALAAASWFLVERRFIRRFAARSAPARRNASRVGSTTAVFPSTRSATASRWPGSGRRTCRSASLPRSRCRRSSSTGRASRATRSRARSAAGCRSAGAGCTRTRRGGCCRTRASTMRGITSRMWRARSTPARSRARRSCASTARARTTAPARA
jgi:peptidoglycan/LPS O-acetylase OafA/YrhL